MLPVQRRFLILELGFGAALVNVAINGLVAWLIFRGNERVPLWGMTSIASDLLGTTFFLPLIFCLIATPLARRDVKRGRIPPLERSRQEHWYFRRLPASARKRAVVLGAIATLLFAPATLVTFAALGVTSLPFWPFVAYKALFAGALAGIFGPLIGVWAIVRFTDD